VLLLMNFYPNTTRKNLLTKTSWFQTKEKRRPGRVVAVGSSCYWTRLSRSRRLGSRGLLNPERADERESGQGLEIKKKNKKKLQHFLLSPLENDDDM
jgi:hypothetical protein